MNTDRAAMRQLKDTEDQIDWVLAHPGFSDWLKDALRAARDRDPVETLNDIEVLNTILRPRSEALIAQSLSDAQGR